jgi:Fe2+ transport system protein FeoA
MGSVQTDHLATVAPGQKVRINSLLGRGEQTHRLRELGVLEGRTVRVIDNHDPLICQVGNCRFGLCHRLARCVLVENLPDAGNVQSA